MMKKTLARTPSPKEERIFGSSINKPKSASSKISAAKIVFSNELENTIAKKVKEYNANNPSNKISIVVAKAVVRRGMGAYSRSHRPTITAGKPNARVAWGLARLSAFMRKKSNSETAKGSVIKRRIKRTYKQDNDLI
jgi:hypothetical protein